MAIWRTLISAFDSYDGIGALDNLRLTYSAPWPLNIVVGKVAEILQRDRAHADPVKRVKYQLDSLHHEPPEIIAVEKRRPVKFISSLAMRTSVNTYIAICSSSGN